MAVLDARQFGRQRLATGADAFSLARFAVTCVRWDQLRLDGSRCLQAQQFTCPCCYSCHCAGAEALKHCQSPPATSHCHCSSVNCKLVSCVSGHSNWPRGSQFIFVFNMNRSLGHPINIQGNYR
jgi:hypothetical protein